MRKTRSPPFYILNSKLVLSEAEGFPALSLPPSVTKQGRLCVFHFFFREPTHVPFPLANSVSRITMSIWFAYKTPDLSERQYNTPLPEVHK